jgi:hypothetical protein
VTKSWILPRSASPKKKKEGKKKERRRKGGRKGRKEVAYANIQN